MKILLKEAAKNKKNWSLYRLAKELGLPQQTVYSWANGRTQPSYENMDRLCEVLECTMSDLFEAETIRNKQMRLNIAVAPRVVNKKLS